ncbi:hypothetical protein BGZ47_002166 [Haplosporangium gracile]|nr:hypothetical protein BGZ47_002166 [Haplosporangium gracile]
MVIPTSRLAIIALVLYSVVSADSALPISIKHAATTLDAFSAENNYNVKLPKLFPLNDITKPYDRLGGLCAAQFLVKWTVNGAYTYPDNNGFVISASNVPIKGNYLLS